MAFHYTKIKIQILCPAMAYMIRLCLSLQLYLLSLFPLSPHSNSCDPFYSRDFTKLICALGLCISFSFSHPTPLT